jgi:xanthine phosphoribosyltransferase
VYSFTHREESVIRVSKDYLTPGQRVLIIDDFLANGEAVNGLMDIVRQACCSLVGVGVCIEKGFQPGGRQLREQGIKVVSLATVDAIRDGKIQVRRGRLTGPHSARGPWGSGGRGGGRKRSCSLLFGIAMRF